MTLTFVPKKQVLPQGMHVWNMKALSHTIQKLWPMLKFVADKQTVYAPDLSM